jgi:transcriptional regulator with XRE-family HTH domain
MQAAFSSVLDDLDMAKAASRLRELRERAGLSLRELTRQIGEDHSSGGYWERSGKLLRADLLMPIAKALGVTVEELLCEARPKRVVSPGGRMRQLFEAASKLPRSQQEKVHAGLEPFVSAHDTGNGH